MNAHREMGTSRQSLGRREEPFVASFYTFVACRHIATFDDMKLPENIVILGASGTSFTHPEQQAVYLTSTVQRQIFLMP